MRALLITSFLACASAVVIKSGQGVSGSGNAYQSSGSPTSYISFSTNHGSEHVVQPVTVAHYMHNGQQYVPQQQYQQYGSQQQYQQQYSPVAQSPEAQYWGAKQQTPVVAQIPQEEKSYGFGQYYTQPEYQERRTEPVIGVVVPVVKQQTPIASKYGQYVPQQQNKQQYQQQYVAQQPQKYLVKEETAPVAVISKYIGGEDEGGFQSSGEDIGYEGGFGGEEEIGGEGGSEGVGEEFEKGFEGGIEEGVSGIGGESGEEFEEGISGGIEEGIGGEQAGNIGGGLQGGNGQGIQGYGKGFGGGIGIGSGIQGGQARRIGGQQSFQQKGGAQNIFAKHSAHGGKGNKDTQFQQQYKKGGKGEIAKKHDQGFYKKDGGKKAGHFEGVSQFDNHYNKQQALKGEKIGAAKHHKKGQKTSGFHNVYKKDEYKKTKTFYDDSDDKGYHSKQGKYQTRVGAAKAAQKKGGKSISDYHGDNFGKKGSHNKVHFVDGEQGFKGQKSHQGHHSAQSGFAQESGKKGGNQYGYIGRQGIQGGQQGKYY